MKKQNGFTILEIAIVTTIIMIVSLIILVAINPYAQIKKVQDARRKRDLNQMAKIFEEYYSDHSTYPIESDICMDTPNEDDGICSCHVCGLTSPDSTLKKYSSSFFCDPENPKKNYLYQYTCNTALQWFRLCASLHKPDDESVTSYYNYGVASSNTDSDACYLYTADDVIGPNPTNTPAVIPTDTPLPSPSPTTSVLPTCYPDPIRKWCFKSGCNDCGTFANCLLPSSCSEPYQLYDSLCAQECQY